MTKPIDYQGLAIEYLPIAEHIKVNILAEAA